MMRNQLLCIVLCSVLCGCTYPVEIELISDRNRGGYTLNYTFSEENVGDTVQVFGTVYDLATRLPIPFSSLEIGCRQESVDDSGRFELQLSKNISGEVYFIATSIGYHSIITQSLEMNSTRIQLDFYLQLDTRPIIDCY